MSRKIIALLFVLSLLATAGCSGKKVDLTPPSAVPVVSFSPSEVLISDGLYEVGRTMPAGTWESLGVPADTPRCVWFVTPSPSKDPDTQNLPSFVDFYEQHHKIRIVLDEPGMGFYTKNCGQWKLQDLR